MKLTDEEIKAILEEADSDPNFGENITKILDKGFKSHIRFGSKRSQYVKKMWQLRKKHRKLQSILYMFANSLDKWMEGENGKNN